MEWLLLILFIGWLISRHYHKHYRRIRHRPPGRIDSRGPRFATPEQRRIVLRRDGYRCRHCGSRERLEIDHIRPWSWGGRTEVKNLQTLCSSCNAKKGAHYIG